MALLNWQRRSLFALTQRATFHYLHRQFSSSIEVVDQMITHVRSQPQGNLDQAVDVLKQGLALQPDSGLGVQAGRLLLALAELELDRSNVSLADQLASAAVRAAAEAEPSSSAEAVQGDEVQLQAVRLATRAQLMQGADADALQTATQGLQQVRQAFGQAGMETHRWQALVLASSNLAVAQHAAADWGSAHDTAETVLTLAQHKDLRRPATAGRDALIPAALREAAQLRRAQEALDEAAHLYQDAGSAAREALAEASSSAVLRPPQELRETVAGALLGQAIAVYHTHHLEAAEDLLAEALKEAEGISGGGHPRTAFVLLVLARIYARTQRLTFSEGLYREAAKLMQVGPPDLIPEAARGPLVHSSAAAFVSWRYFQLLNAMPKRGTEAAKWEDRAQHYFAKSSGLAGSIESHMGHPENLKGMGDGGAGLVLDLSLRRALPSAPH